MAVMQFTDAQKCPPTFEVVVVQCVVLGDGASSTGRKLPPPLFSSAQQILRSNVVITGDVVVLGVVVLVGVALQFLEPGALLAELIFLMASTAHAGQSFSPTHHSPCFATKPRFR